ncbi:MAG: hypothetical protein MPW16_09220 [Candidatus Manganitrophus sp.]|nr:MAG: hypothetical protein MPW16_09220 [Candidatus Manganitrophus sp.]
MASVDRPNDVRDSSFFEEKFSRGGDFPFDHYLPGLFLQGAEEEHFDKSPRLFLRAKARRENPGVVEDQKVRRVQIFGKRREAPMFDRVSFSMVDKEPRLIPLGRGRRCDQGGIKGIIISRKVLFIL